MAGCLVTFLYLFSTVPVVRADDRDPVSRAAALKAEGATAFANKDWETALVKFNEAYELSKDPALLYNRARTLESMGELPRALDAIEAFEQTASPELKAKVNGLDEVIRTIRSRVATVVVSSNVDDAEVRLNDRVVGKTANGSARLRVKTGALLRIELVHPSYLPCTVDVDGVRGGETRSATCTLSSRDSSGILVVKSMPGTQVSVDGTPGGVVPYERVVQKGAHNIVLTKDGYGTFSTTAVVRSGETKVVQVDALPSIPITSRWWFWTGIGVILVGGGITTYVALTTERSADRGSIQPGVVRAAGFPVFSF
jgi:hypothetical protein